MAPGEAPCFLLREHKHTNIQANTTILVYFVLRLPLNQHVLSGLHGGYIFLSYSFWASYECKFAETSTISFNCFVNKQIYQEFRWFSVFMDQRLQCVCLSVYLAVG